MVENLSERASLLVSAIVLSLSSLICLYQIYKFIKSYKYPQAQGFCIVLFAMPILMGWTSWVNLMSTSRVKFLEFMINLYKSVAIVCFIYYVDRLIGWVERPEGHRYDSENVDFVFMSMEKADCYFRCWPSTSLDSKEKARRFRWKTRICIMQFPVVLMVSGIVGLILFFGYGWRAEYGNHMLKYYWWAETAVELTSSGIAMNYLINYSFFANRIPELNGLKIMSKFVLMKLSMVLTEI